MDGGAAACPEGANAYERACVPRFDECEPGEVPVFGGGCTRVGPPAECWAGFAAASDGACEPILPSGPCADGEIPLIGSTACAPIRDCGDAPWGSVDPAEGDVFVDASYAGADADGTEARPFARLQDAVDVAAPGARVLVAAGEYVENVQIDARVRIEGRCPDLVTVRGVTGDLPAIFVEWDGAEVRGVGVTGPRQGILVLGASDVVIAEVALRDCGRGGVVVGGGSEVALERALFARNDQAGLVVVEGAAATATDVAILATEAGEDGLWGFGVRAESDSATGETPSVTIRRAVIEGSRVAGVSVVGGALVVEDAVVRDTRPEAASLLFGHGIDVQDDPFLALASGAEVRRVLVERNRGAGLNALGSTMTVEDATVRDTAAYEADAIGGTGVSAVAGVGPSAVAVSRALLAGNREIGLHVDSSSAVLRDVVVRDTLPSAATGEMGRGVNLQFATAPTTLRRVLLEGNRDTALFVAASTAEIEDSLVRDTLPQESDAGFGRGISVQRAAGVATDVAVRRTVVERSHEVAVFAGAAAVRFEDSIVRDTLLDEGEETYGLGFAAYADPDDGSPASVDIRRSLVEGSRLVGVYALGSEILLDRAVVRDTDGWGLLAQFDDERCAPAGATLRDSVIERSLGFGAVAIASALSVESSTVRGTLAEGGVYGDGVAADGDWAPCPPGALDVAASTIDGNARAGILYYRVGGTLRGTVVRDNRFAVVLESGADPAIAGDNSMGDNEIGGVTTAQGIEPPPAVEPIAQ